jgi:hypothetical protein
MEEVTEKIDTVLDGLVRAQPESTETAKEKAAEQDRRYERIRAYCRSRKYVDDYVRRSGVRRRLREESPDLDLDLIPPECNDWLNLWREGASMILCGPPGSGKTTAAVWCIRRLCIEADLKLPEPDDADQTIGWSAPVVLFMKTADLYDAVFAKNETPLHTAENVSVLVLDDWGADYEHAWPLSRLDRLIDRRWDEKLPTIITTNLHAEQLDESLPRAFDRMTGFPGPGVVVIARESLRQRGAFQKVFLDD